jgi:PIN domain nuclease of toxin-antitoxin system
MRAAPDRLTKRERAAIDAAPRRTVSVASLWEIALLTSLGRIDNDPRLFIMPYGVESLPLLSDHCHELINLPHIHRDPFDRMLIAQARIENLLLVTRDAKIASYGRDGAATAVLGPTERA